jgi:hypothetical protein
MDRRPIDFAIEDSPSVLEPEHGGYDVIDLLAGRNAKSFAEAVVGFEGKFLRFLTEEYHVECRHAEWYINAILSAKSETEHRFHRASDKDLLNSIQHREYPISESRCNPAPLFRRSNLPGCWPS